MPVIRESHTAAQSFLDGASLPEAGGGVARADRDTLLVRTNFGDGFTDSDTRASSSDGAEGHPSKRQRRFSRPRRRTSRSRRHDHTPGYERTFASIATSFFTSELYEITAKGPRRVEKPASATGGVWRDHVMFKFRDDWAPRCHLCSRLPRRSALRQVDAREAQLEVLFEPFDVEILQSFQLRAPQVLSLLSDVKVRTRVSLPALERAAFLGFPTPVKHHLPVDSRASDDYWIRYSGFPTPTTWRPRHAGRPSARGPRHARRASTGPG